MLTSKVYKKIKIAKPKILCQLGQESIFFSTPVSDYLSYIISPKRKMDPTRKYEIYKVK